MTHKYLTTVLAALTLAASCARERAPAPPPASPLGEDEFAARAAAVAKSCELATVYLGRDDERAAAVVDAARDEALTAVRRAPDAHRGGAFARAYRRLDDAAITLAGTGHYNTPLSISEYDRLRDELTAAADELRPLGEPYYRKLTRRYVGPRRPAKIWGPLATPVGGGRAAPETKTPSVPPPASPPAPTAATGATAP